jgi:ParB-like chromosome segregation protein Spo0J
MDANIRVDTETVAINELKPYPRNPRRGDVEEIAKSLETNGQYKPIVANRRDGAILAGNHTWRAARSLGWATIAVSWVDVDEDEAARIVLADNRTSDMSIYDDSKLLELLQSLPDLKGTGFTDNDIDQLNSLFDGEGLFTAPNSERTGKVGNEIRVCVGSYRCLVDDDVYEGWASSIESIGEAKDIEEELRKRLNLSNATAIPPKKRAGRPVKKKIAKEEMKTTVVETGTVDINSVFPYPMNARQGDVGLIAQSLSKNGQFRPIVVNKSDNSILVGNHTWKAAKSLGWKEIAVSWVDVDEEAAARIVLADNRTADLGSYDHVELVEVLKDMKSFEGTGYTGEDVDDLLKEVAGWGLSDVPAKPQDDVEKERNVTAIIGIWEIKFERKFYDEWEEYMFQEYGYSYEEVCGGIMEMLRVPDDSWVCTRQRKSKRKSSRRQNGE